MITFKLCSEETLDCSGYWAMDEVHLEFIRGTVCMFQHPDTGYADLFLRGMDSSRYNV